MRLTDKIQQGKVEGSTGRDILNALKKSEDLDKPVIISVLHTNNSEEMPAMFDIADIMRIDDHILISCCNALVPGTVDKLVEGIDYKTVVNFGNGNSIDIKTIKR